MRWYYIKFIPSAGQSPYNIPGFVMEYGSSSRVQSLFNPNGSNIMGALEVEFDFTVSALDQRVPDGHVRIYNPPLDVIQNADAYRGMNVEIYGGFASHGNIGYPLATPYISGLIGYGRVAMSYANWVGGDMAIDLVLSPALNGVPSVAENPESNANYQFLWKKGQTFEDALRATFNKIGVSNITFNITSNIENPGYDVIISNTDGIAFSNQIRRKTADLMNTPYIFGVSIFQDSDGSVVVTDQTNPIQTIQIKPEHIIGQPTISYTGEYLAVQSVHPMRADIRPGIGIQFKKSISMFTPGKAFSYPRPLTLENEIMFVQRVRQVGKFRDASHQGWATVLESGIMQARV